MALDDIEKLRAKVDKDPSSRLFLPLAEEYRKSGMLDEAIGVLLSGLDRHPGYTSARVALGRIYLEKSMINEARTEFERVVDLVPDNLFAHRKLADIYRDLDMLQRAEEEYRTVLALNPLDEEAKACLDAIVRTASEPPEETISAGAAGEAVERSFEVSAVEEAVGDISESDYLGGEISDDEPVETGEPFALDDEDEFEAFSKALSEEVSAGPEEIDGDSAADEFPEILVEETAVSDIFPEEISVEDAGDVIGETAPLADLSAVDSMIAEGKYSQAIRTYNEMLSRDPENRHLLQRTAELKAYLKMIGRDKEMTISRLETFLDGMKRRFRRAP